jgi:hypothetical protein
MYSKYNFKTRGIGMISIIPILKNTYIGNYLSKTEIITNQSRAIYDGWIETNPLGRYINHNSTPNCRLIKDENYIKLYSIRDIEKWEELTVDYLNMTKVINLPEQLIKKYSIINYPYIDEPIVVVSSLI